MTKSIEIITNGLNSFELNREISKGDMWKVAQEAGFEGGRTSFMNLLNGKVAVACGYSIEIQVLVEQTETVKAVNSAIDKVTALKQFSFEIHVVEAKTETYGTVQVKCGRIQLNPLNNGTYSVMVLPKKGYVVEDVFNMMGYGKVKSQYVQAGKLMHGEIEKLVKTLS